MNGLLKPNLLILVVCQLVSVSGSVLIVTLGGIVGAELSGRASLATLPMALMVVGTAVGTLPAAWMMQRLGRRNAFVIGLVLGGVGMGLGALSLSVESFGLFCVATTVQGVSMAASQHYRFAAAESVQPALVSQAVSIVLLGSIGGAILGPELVKVAGGELASFQAPLQFAAGLYVLAVLVILGFRDRTGSDHAPAGGKVRFRVLLSRRFLLAAVAAGVVGQGVMTLIMTATPLSMHVMDGFSLADTASVIRNHVLAMYVPSLFSGWLIARMGVGPIVWLGLVIFIATVGIGLLGHSYLHYSASMIALGIGWNFLFVGGTTMLVRAFEPDERFAAQALNDFAVFGGSAVASLAAGGLLHLLGWEGLLLAALPILLALAVLLLLVRGDARLRAE